MSDLSPTRAAQQRAARCLLAAACEDPGALGVAVAEACDEGRMAVAGLVSIIAEAWAGAIDESTEPGIAEQIAQAMLLEIDHERSG